MKTTNKFLAVLLVFVPVFLVLVAYRVATPDDWGFFGHRRLNRLAVFTLPREMMPFFKKHIEYLTEHAVDPDKRRYASRFEAVRHYIDLDHWGMLPFPDLPRSWVDALAQQAVFKLCRSTGDTLVLNGTKQQAISSEEWLFSNIGTDADVDSLYTFGSSYRAYRDFFKQTILPQYYEDFWIIPLDSLAVLWGDSTVKSQYRSAIAVDRFSEYGILPYHLIRMQTRLTAAFRNRDEAAILRLCAEFGHYIGDAHVPLHTTENYNGQLTGQNGIHAFWESRLPELFADRHYNYFTGRATYISDLSAFYWKIVLDSHALVDSVLRVERRLQQSYPLDRQFCAEERLGQTIRTQCRDYAAAFHKSLGDMVEQRMRATIHAIGSAWFTAWVDAGQPDLGKLENGRNTDEPAREGDAETQKTGKSGLRNTIHKEN